jgi:hypothetical protein
MKHLLFSLLAVGLTSCISTPLNEINYRGALPSTVVDANAEAERFAEAWSQESTLPITARVRSSTPRNSAIVELRSAQPEIVATVLVSLSDRAIFASVNPGSEKPKSEELAAASVRVYQRLYGGAAFERFVRHGGLFGP